MYNGVQYIVNIIYIVNFLDRIENKTPPYFYIGSKVNCEFENGLIYVCNRNGERTKKIYYGSSEYKDYHNIVKNSHIEVEILEKCDDPKLLPILERNYHIERDVMKSIEYFNLSINTISTFAMGGYGTYRHKDDPYKRIRLPVNDPLVINGTYIGATSGYKPSDDTRKKISESNSGEKNSFYGKKHTEETNRKIGEKNKGRIKSEETLKKLSKSLTGRKFTQEHKEKIGKKGYITLKNIITDVVIRIHNEQKHLYDESIWINPYKLKSIKGELRTGYANLRNINTGERIRIDKEDLAKYDRSIWISPQAYAISMKKGK